MRREQLTAYQAQQIYQEKGQRLVLGNYVVLDKLGQGGMGLVLKAVHRRMERIVALKVLSPAAVKSPDAVQRFHREAKAAARLTHPNIVTAFDADEAGGTHFLVMEYVDGVDLSQRVKQKGPLPVDKALPCLVQAARGLEYAHDQGVIHRDIKPANLLLDASGTIKILDMGLARIDAAGAEQAELTSTGQIMGTVDYMAPEQALNTRTADARSDIYSLGMTLWYLLTGRAAYPGETLMARLMAHAHEPPPSLTSVCPEASAALEQVFRRMVAKSPAERFQTMGEVIAALEACRGGRVDVSPTVQLGGSEDSKLSDFLRGLGGSASGRSLVSGPMPAAPAPVAPGPVADNRRGPPELEQTIDTGRDPVDTDPQSQDRLAAPPPAPPRTPPARTAPPPEHSASASRRASGPLWVIAGGVLSATLLLTLLAYTLANRASPARDPAAGLAPLEEIAGQSPYEILTSLDWEWSEPVRLFPNLTLDHGRPALSRDGLTLIVGIKDGGGVGGWDLWQSTRPHRQALWSEPVHLGETVNSTLDEFSPTLNQDKTTLFFSNPEGLFQATLDAANRWSDPTPLFEGIKANEVVLSPDDCELYICVQDGDTRNIYQATRRTTSEPWSQPELVPGPINSPEEENPCSISGDNRILFLNRGRRGDRKLYISRRESAAEPWGAPVLLPAHINLGSSQWRCSVSSDGQELYFDSNRHSPCAIFVTRRVRRDTASGSVGGEPLPLGPLPTLASRQGASPLDRLRRESIAPAKLKDAGGGDPARAPTELVAILGDTRLRHWAPVKGLAYSRDGAWLASASDDGAVKVWRAATGDDHRTLLGHAAGVRGVAWSPDGTVLASAGADKVVKLWDVAQGRDRFTLAGHEGEVAAVAICPRGEWVASASDDKQVVLWSLATGQRRHTLAGHGGRVTSVAFSPDGQTLASGSHDKTVKLWNVATGQEQRTLTGHTTGINCLAFSPLGDSLAAGADWIIRRWRLPSGEDLPQLSGDQGNVRSLAFRPDGAMLAIGSSGPSVQSWDLATSKHLGRFSTQGGQVWSVAFSPDGQTLATGADNRRIKLWNVASGEELPAPPNHGPSLWSPLAFSPDGGTLAMTADGNSIQLWDAATERMRLSIPANLTPRPAIRFGADGDLLASTQWGGEALIQHWDTTTGAVKHRHGPYKYEDFALRPDGREVAIVGRAGVTLTDNATGKVHRTYPSGHAWRVGYRADGRIIGLAEARQIRLWDVFANQELSSLPTSNRAKALEFSTHGTLLAAAIDNTVKIWDTASGQERTSIRLDSLTDVRLHPGGGLVATAGADGKVRLFRIDDGQEQVSFSIGPPRGSIYFLAFDPTGRYLATVNANGSVGLLRLENLRSP